MGACLIRNKLDVLLMNRFVMVRWHFSLRRIEFFLLWNFLGEEWETATTNRRSQMPTNRQKIISHRHQRQPFRNIIKYIRQYGGKDIPVRTIFNARRTCIHCHWQHQRSAAGASSIRVNDWLNESDPLRWIPQILLFRFLFTNYSNL